MYKDGYYVLACLTKDDWEEIRSNRALIKLRSIQMAKNKLITGIQYQRYTDDKAPIIYKDSYCLVHDFTTGEYNKYAIKKDIQEGTLIISPDYEKSLE
jgi:hypothetical protein